MKHTHVWKEVVQRTLDTLNETNACMERSCWMYTWYFQMKHTHVWKEVVQRTLNTINETYACMERSCSTYTW